MVAAGFQASKYRMRLPTSVLTEWYGRVRLPESNSSTRMCSMSSLPTELVKTAWYSLPFCAAWAVKLRVSEVAPLMFVKELPPSVLSCHCTVGVGVPYLREVPLNVVPLNPVVPAPEALPSGPDFEALFRWIQR